MKRHPGPTNEPNTLLAGFLIFSLTVAVILRCTFYGIYGADLGVIVINDQGDITFQGLDENLGINLLASIQSHGSTSVDSFTISTSNPVDLEVPYYLDISHPCNSFYDAVCGIFDTDGSQNVIEDIAISSKGGNLHRSSGTFHDVAQASQVITLAVLENISTFNHCINYVSGLIDEVANADGEFPLSTALSWNNLPIPPMPNAEHPLATLYERGLELPIIMEVKKLFHRSDFGLHMRLNPLPMLDVAFNPHHLGDTERDSLTRFYKRLIEMDPSIMVEIESVGDYMETCFPTQNVGKMGPHSANFNALVGRILPQFKGNVPYMCFKPVLITGLLEFDNLVRQSVTGYHTFFSKLTLTYGGLEYLRLDEFLPSNKVVQFPSRHFRLGVLQEKAVSPLSTVSNFFYNVPYRRMENENFYSKEVGRVLKEHLSAVVLQPICKYSNGGNHTTSHQLILSSFNHFFLVEINKREVTLSLLVISAVKGVGANEPTAQSVIKMCNSLTSNIDRDRVNRDFALATEIKVAGDFTPTYRSEGVLNLVQRILNNTRELIRASTFKDSRTHAGLVRKLDNVVIRVMGPVGDTLVNGSWAPTYRDLGFKSLEGNPCNSPLDSCFEAHFWQSLEPNLLSLTSLMQQCYFSFSNKFNIFKRRASLAPYLDYRSNYSMYKWDDIMTDVSFPIVNAWYDPLHNTITIPIGISLFPMFRNVDELDDAILGVVIGHELGHALDHNGRFFDEFGNYVYNDTIDDEQDDGLWFPPDLIEISERIDCLANEYGHPCGDDAYGYHTLGEDIADQIGILSGMMALVKDEQKALNDQYINLAGISPISNTTILREYFVNYARLWCGRSSKDDQCAQVAHDPHALAKHRVNKALKPIGEFLEAFQCHPSSTMAQIKDKSCLIYH